MWQNLHFLSPAPERERTMFIAEVFESCEILTVEGDRRTVGAGRLIDQCGLKGFRVGDAQISHIHANIMVNLGQATAREVRELIAITQRAVDEKFGQHLEPEIKFVGEF